MEPQNIAKWLQEPNPGQSEQSPLEIIQEGRVDIKGAFDSRVLPFRGTDVIGETATLP